MKRIVLTRRMKLALWVGLCVILFNGIDYVLDARMRARMLPECRWEEDRPYQNTIPYLVRWCIVKRDVVMFRVYDKEGKKLLAERMFDYPDLPLIYWSSKEVGYRTFSDWGAVALPPSALDEWRTHLP
ncbi:hypothetical protein [Pseudacidovorax intermedius]|uniref:hypothetical protein n=1 Tax=Pseudacidovorax intermedius TaxID=433924 RepID=UPI001AFE4878|nr:hypothetical protein [Pseudacidovorax intermedius]MBO9645649.1 hypothetical protein [Pseudacidovorax sp.]